MNEKKYEFRDWKDILSEMDEYQLDNFNFAMKHIDMRLDAKQEVTLGRILHWLKVIRDAGTMEGGIRLGDLRYGTKDLPLYKISFLIQSIESIIQLGKYSVVQQYWLNGLHQWYKDNDSNLKNSYS